MTPDTHYFVEDNFLSEDECVVLIATAQKYFEGETGFSIHGGRQTHPNTDLNFHELLKLSQEWRRLDERLLSTRFRKTWL